MYSTGPVLGVLPIIISSSLLKVTYPRESLTSIVIHVLVGCYISPEISRSACINGMLSRTSKIIKKRKKNHFIIYYSQIDILIIIKFVTNDHIHRKPPIFFNFFLTYCVIIYPIIMNKDPLYLK